MKYTLRITVLMSLIISGCTLPDAVDRGEDCANVESMMTENVLLKSDIAKAEIDTEMFEKIKLGFETGYCAYDTMACIPEDHECTLKCNVEGQESNKIVSDGSCRVYRCTNGALKNTGVACNECKDNYVTTYTNNANNFCIETSCVEGKITEITDCQASCTKENSKFTGCGECLNGQTKSIPGNGNDPDQEFKCVDGKWEEIPFQAECENNFVSYQNESDNRCSETTCQKGRKVKSKTCETSCLRDATNNTFTGCGECLNSTMKCEGTTQYRCEDGTWKPYINCTLGCNENIGLCLTCQNDSFRCNDEFTGREKCVNNEWKVDEICPLGCHLGSCIECENGEDRCQDSEVSTCINGIWVKQKYCSGGCNGKVCGTPTVPSSSLCKMDQFEEVCVDGFLYTCQNNKVYKTACNDDSNSECVQLTNGTACSRKQDDIDKYCSMGQKYIFYSSNACDQFQYYHYLECTTDISGKTVLLTQHSKSLCTQTPFYSYRYSCDASNQEVQELCKSCSPDAEGNSICMADDINATHKLGDPCTDSTASACDGDVLIQCNGAKYVAAYTDETGNVYKCSEAFDSNYYCDELRELSHASCARECNALYAGSESVYNTSCVNNKFNRFLCEKGQTDNLSLFDGFYITSMCHSETEMISCDEKTNKVKTTSCTAGCQNPSGEQSDAAVCKQVDLNPEESTPENPAPEE